MNTAMMITVIALGQAANVWYGETWTGNGHTLLDEDNWGYEQAKFHIRWQVDEANLDRPTLAHVTLQQWNGSIWTAPTKSLDWAPDNKFFIEDLQNIYARVSEDTRELMLATFAPPIWRIEYPNGRAFWIDVSELFQVNGFGQLKWAEKVDYFENVYEYQEVTGKDCYDYLPNGFDGQKAPDFGFPSADSGTFTQYLTELDPENPITSSPLPSETLLEKDFYMVGNAARQTGADFIFVSAPYPMAYRGKILQYYQYNARWAKTNIYLDTVWTRDVCSAIEGVWFVRKQIYKGGTWYNNIHEFDEIFPVPVGTTVSSTIQDKVDNGDYTDVYFTPVKDFEPDYAISPYTTYNAVKWPEPTTTETAITNLLEEGLINNEVQDNFNIYNDAAFLISSMSDVPLTDTWFETESTNYEDQEIGLETPYTTNDEDNAIDSHDLEEAINIGMRRALESTSIEVNSDAMTKAEFEEVLDIESQNIPDSLLIPGSMADTDEFASDFEGEMLVALSPGIWPTTNQFQSMGFDFTFPSIGGINVLPNNYHLELVPDVNTSWGYTLDIGIQIVRVFIMLYFTFLFVFAMIKIYKELT